MDDKERLNQANKDISKGFFGFWVKQRRVTILILVMIVLIGTFSAYRIPKESFPDVQLNMVTVVTVYPGGSPEDIDSLITKKIEDQISGIDGIDSIDSTSSDNVSTVIATLENDVDVDSVANKVQDAVDTISFPSDANDPIVSQIDSDAIGKMMFSLVIYAKDSRYDENYLKDKAIAIKKSLEGVGKIDTVTLNDGASISIVGGNNSAELYDIQVLVDEDKIEQLGLPITQIATILQGYNVSQPLGTHTLGEKEYSFRIDGEINSIEELGKTPIPLGNGKTISLESIATIKKVFDSDAQVNIGHFENGEKNSGNLAVVLGFNRKSSASVLAASKEAKKIIAEEMSKEEYKGLGYFFTNDIGDNVSDLYNDLIVNMVSTLLVVFLIVLCFVGATESFLATISIPIAFFVTFYVLNALGYTMNTLTNFSLIICLGIAVDSATVIIQGASEYMKQGYKPLHAALLSVKTYKNSLISGTATTVVVFIPLMMLPGVIGKTMSIIPITIFATLVASLFVSLTGTPTIFFLTRGDDSTYKRNEDEEKYLNENQKILLESDREGKQEIKDSGEISFRDKILNKLIVKYDKSVKSTLNSKVKSTLWIILPLVLLFLTITFVSTKIGFLLMPKYDSESVSVTLTADAGLTTDKMIAESDGLHDVLASIPELTHYTSTVNGNTISVSITLIDHEDRKRTSFDIEEELTEKLQFLKQKGFDVSVSTISNSIQGSSSEVGIKIKAKNGVDQDVLTKVARDFENYLKTIPGTKNITNSSKESPGQFVFTLNEDKLSMLGLTKSSIGPSLYLALNGMDAGSLKIDGDSHDIKIKYNDFDENVSPDVLMGTILMTQAGQIPLASIADYTFKPAVTNITREDGDITVDIGANLIQGVKAENVNNQLYRYGDSYDFPEGISYSKGGEQVENADLIQSLLVSVVVAFILIFGILLTQFNSYTQPLVISYSLLMGFIGATYGMLFTGNPYSMMFLIGFVALMGIIVNNAIILIDSANSNISHGYSREDAIVESAKSRLKPILSTTFTTVIGMATLLTNGMFAPLGLTIMFGLSFGTVVTLFAIPVLYNDEDKIRRIIKRCLINPLILVFVPLLAVGILYLISIMFGISITETILGKSLMISLGLFSFIFVFITDIIGMKNENSGWRLSLLKMKITSTDDSEIKLSSIIKRLLLKYLLLLSPIIVVMLLTVIFRFLGLSDSLVSLLQQTLLIVSYLFYIFGNIYCFWMSDGTQFIHDKILNLKIYDTNK